MVRIIIAFIAMFLTVPLKANKPASDPSNTVRSRSFSPLHSTTGNYLHSWHSFPTIAARAIDHEQILRFTPERGLAQVVIFLASWCLPCQQLLPEFQKLEQDFVKRHTRFIYVFAHDTQADAQGFKKHYKMGNNAILGTAQILKDFRQPELPSVFISDRYNWLVMQKLNTKWSDLKDIERFLAIHTAY